MAPLVARPFGGDAMSNQEKVGVCMYIDNSFTLKCLQYS